MKDIFHTRKCLTPEEIQGYLNESLSEEALHSIEQHLIDCELCNTAFEGWSKIDQPEIVMSELEATDLKTLTSAPAVKPPEKKKTIPFPKIFMATAATIALVIASFIVISQLKPNPSKLFESNYELAKMPDPTTRNSDISDIRELTKKAWEAYSQEDFNTSINYFEKILQIDRINPTALLFGGISYLETGQNEKAIISLDNLASQKSSQYAEDANWYLALALLKQKDFERCREVLRDIQQKEGFYAKKAAKLVKKLE